MRTFFSAYQRLSRRLQEAVGMALPPDATVIVVSKGDEELLKLGDDRRGWHFPQNEEGVYAGHYPADSAQAIAHLEELRTKGAEFLLFPATALWWLEKYGEFGRYLDSRYRRLYDDDICLIYRLAKPETGAVDSHEIVEVSKAEADPAVLWGHH